MSPRRTFLLSLLAAFSLAAAPTTRTSWLGNTFGGADGRWVQNNIAALYVSPDGTCYTDSHWDEAGHEAGIYKDGQPAGACNDTHNRSHGGFAVAADAQHIYLAFSLKDGVGGIRHYDLAGNPAPFPGGGHDGSFQWVGPSAGTVRGLCTTATELFATDFDANLVHVYTTATMKPARTFPLERPTRLIADPQGNLWIIQAKDAAKPAAISCFTATGQLIKGQTITDAVDPVALAIDPRGHLLVADNGPDQQVRIYDIKNQSAAPKLLATLGEKGGIFTGRRGATGPLRFNGLTGVGADAAGRIYVSTNGFGPRFADHPGYGAELKCFEPKGDFWNLRWQLQGLEFVAMAEPDPDSESDVFTQNQHFVMDYSKETGHQWTYVGQTIDRLAYPDDLRLHASCECVLGVRRIQGQRYLYLSNMYSTLVAIFRWDPDNERFLPSGILAAKSIPCDNGNFPPHQPPGDWIWRDANADGHFDPKEFEPHNQDNPFVWGWCVDSQGTIFKALRENGIRRFPLQGLDPHGNPQYSYLASSVIPNPPPFDATPAYRGDINRIEYDAANDAMYLAGYTAAHPNTRANPNDSPSWGQAGPVICRYDHWSKGNRQPTWEINPPYNPDASPQLLDKAMHIAGDYLFLTYLSQPQVLIYDLHTAKHVTTLIPGPEVGGHQVSWVDIPFGIKAYRRKSGEYLIFNEEDWRGKILLYRWTP